MKLPWIFQSYGVDVATRLHPVHRGPIDPFSVPAPLAAIHDSVLWAPPPSCFNLSSLVHNALIWKFYSQCKHAFPASQKTANAYKEIQLNRETHMQATAELISTQDSTMPLHLRGEVEVKGKGRLVRQALCPDLCAPPLLSCLFYPLPLPMPCASCLFSVS